MDEHPNHKWVIAGTVMIGNIMAVLDSSIVNVALPDMAGNLGATVEEITWVVTGYILANVLILPTVGMLSSRFGRKRLYMVAIAVFTAASMLCGLAASLRVMVAFRAVQGLAGGVLVTVPQAILRESFPPEEQGVAMGVYGMGVVIAPAIGPTLGGWITDAYSWPWIFYINVPVGIINILMVQRLIEDPPYLVRTRARMDFLGLGLMIAGLGAFQLLLEEGEKDDWFQSAFIVRLAVIATLGMVLFVWRELRTKRPAVDLRVLSDLGFTAATFMGGIMGAGLSGVLFILPLFLQNLLGYTAMDSGLTLMPRSLAMLVMMPIAGRMYNKLGPRAMVAAGLLLIAYGYWALGDLTLDIGYWDLVWPQVWQGVGFSLLFAALSTAALASIAKERMTAATGLYNVVRQVMGSIGIAAAATLLTHSEATYHASIVETASGPVAQQFLQATAAALQKAGSDAAAARERALAIFDAKVWQQATVLAYNHIFLLVAALFVATVPLVLLLRRSAHEGPIEIVAD
jgi:DHA2 family multidrug resistance protein